ncbi:MAG: MFS transporter [Candidatus Viridilinea halotolerans]|uniref:MFS transporter n=1 Tax=Candidatus Viridilinea halotolerans TaxID=2491704 RepID=A0A426TWG3_9CHLR|nr:MAG: MFS transporter [Candidatus Viridilinea halotolerans]
MAKQRVVLITLGVMISLFMASMESTVIATAMPTIVAQLGGLESYSWVFAIYMLTSTTVVPIFGKLSDIYGRRPIYMAALSLFFVGSLLCALATTMGQLIAARAVQGLGAGGLLPLAFIIVGDIFNLEQRTKVQGLFSAVWGVSSVIGPLVGGFLVDRVAWQWVFLINLPVAIIAAALVWIAWRGFASPSGPRPAIDYAGALLLTLAMATLLLGLNQLGQAYGPLLLGVALVATGLLIWVELRAPAPILPLAMLRRRLFAVACTHGILAGWVLFGGISYVPLFVQVVLGTSATEAGATITPMLLAWVLTSIIASRMLLKVSYRTVILVGMSSFLVGSTILAQIHLDTSRNTIISAVALMGIGMGAAIPAFLIAVQSSVAKHELGSATATLQFSRTIGGTFGVSVLGILLSTQLAAALAAVGLTPDAIPLDALIGEGANGNAALGLQARSALASAMRTMFQSTLVVALLAFLVALFTPHTSPAELAALSNRLPTETP